jgi:hypothetical protein
VILVARKEAGEVEVVADETRCMFVCDRQTIGQNQNRSMANKGFSDTFIQQ